MNNKWQEDLWNLFGEQGYVALAFYAGASIAYEIREYQQSLPFLNIDGERGTGKTSLIQFLNGMYFDENYIGFDPYRSTMAAVTRKINNAKSSPVILIDDADTYIRGNKRFDWESLKVLYNNSPYRIYGEKGSDYVNEEPFKGSLIVEGGCYSFSEALKARVFTITLSPVVGERVNTEAATRLFQYPKKIWTETLNKHDFLLNDYKRFYLEAEALYEIEDTSVREYKNRLQVLALIKNAQVLFDLPTDYVVKTIDMVMQEKK